MSAGGGGPELRALREALASPVVADAHPLSSALRMLRVAAYDCLGAHGSTFQSFWGRFGWGDTPLVIGSQAVQDRVLRLLQGTSLVALLLLALRAKHVVARAITHSRSGRSSRALWLVLANPFINCQLMFAAMAVVVYVLTNNSSPAQGRHWYAFLPVMFWGSRLLRTQRALVSPCGPLAFQPRRGGASPLQCNRQFLGHAGG